MNNINKTDNHYALIENFFPENLRKNLPVNFFMLRRKVYSNEFNGVSSARSDFHCSSTYIVAYYHKHISNIL